jgi:hypothetical protein
MFAVERLGIASLRGSGVRWSVLTRGQGEAEGHRGLSSGSAHYNFIYTNVKEMGDSSLIICLLNAARSVK